MNEEQSSSVVHSIGFALRKSWARIHSGVGLWTVGVWLTLLGTVTGYVTATGEFPLAGLVLSYTMGVVTVWYWMAGRSVYMDNEETSGGNSQNKVDEFFEESPIDREGFQESVGLTDDELEEFVEAQPGDSR